MTLLATLLALLLAKVRAQQDTLCIAYALSTLRTVNSSGDRKGHQCLRRHNSSQAADRSRRRSGDRPFASDLDYGPGIPGISRQSTDHPDIRALAQQRDARTGRVRKESFAEGLAGKDLLVSVNLTSELCLL